MTTNTNTPFRPLSRAARLAACALLLAGAAHGSDGERTPRVTLIKPYVAECAACHIAFLPGHLPAASWGRLMAGLGKHYGTDATLDPKDIQLISQWLNANADDRPRAAAAVPEDRITRTDWFVRKHRSIEAATWRLPSVKSASNCMACHTGADRGQFGEHALRRPEGLSARQRATWDD